MSAHCLYPAGRTPAVHHACAILQDHGIPITPDVGWNTRHLLLDVPSFPPGRWSQEALSTMLASLPRDITIWGGNLDRPELNGYSCRDLLQEESYLLENAAITARCALDILEPMLTDSWENTPALIIGPGRIGKALAKLLVQRNCPAMFAGRNLHRAGSIPTVDLQEAKCRLPEFRLIINTAPSPILRAEDFRGCRCIKMDLASVKGMEGEDVIWARGLPGKYAPEESGKLIANTILQLWEEEP